MKKYLAVCLACLMLAACGKPQVTTPGGYYSGPSAEEERVEEVPTFFTEEEKQAEATCYRICRQNTDGSVTVVADLGAENNTPFFLLEERVYYTAGGSLWSVNFDGEEEKVLYDSSEEQFSFDRITMAEDGWIYCRGTCWREITDDPAALPGPHRVKATARAKADLSEFEILESE
jgi:hypothetical protein